jgi:hypothetical protein
MLEESAAVTAKLRLLTEVRDNEAACLAKLLAQAREAAEYVLSRNPQSAAQDDPETVSLDNPMWQGRKNDGILVGLEPTMRTQRYDLA